MGSRPLSGQAGGLAPGDSQVPARAVGVPLHVGRWGWAAGRLGDVGRVIELGAFRSAVHADKVLRVVPGDSLIGVDRDASLPTGAGGGHVRELSGPDASEEQRFPLLSCMELDRAAG